MNIHAPRFLPFLAVTLISPVLANAEIIVKSGEKIAFLGDSITQGGWSNPAGYVRLVIAGLEANGVKAEPVPAGISGHKSDQMLARLDKGNGVVVAEMDAARIAEVRTSLPALQHRVL